MKKIIKNIVLDFCIIGLVVSGYYFNDYRRFIEVVFYFLAALSIIGLLVIPMDRAYEIFCEYKEIYNNLFYKLYHQHCKTMSFRVWI